MTITKEKVKINFNEPHITYKNKVEKKVVGTTTALNLLNKPQLVGWAYNKGLAGENLYEKDESAKVGTIAHERILAYFQGYEIDNYNISPEAWDLSKNVLESFFEWIEGHTVEPLFVEVPFVSEKYQYGGTIDLYGTLDGKPTLVDFKSGSGIYESHIYQLSAYTNLLIENGYPVERCIPLNIPKSPDDSFAIQSVKAESLKDEFQIFLDLVDIYYKQKSIKDRKKGKK